MNESLLHTQEVKDLLAKVSGLANDAGNPRLKRIMHRVMTDLFRVCAVKGGVFQWVQGPPGNRSSRKQPEQSWR